MAVVWVLDKWRYYLEGRTFSVVTEHCSLIWFFKIQKPRNLIQEFTFTVEYQKGKYNTIPDALSRAPVDLSNCPMPTCATVHPPKREVHKDLHILDEDIWKAQQSDPDIQKLYHLESSVSILLHDSQSWRTRAIGLCNIQPRPCTKSIYHSLSIMDSCIFSTTIHYQDTWADTKHINKAWHTGPR